MSTNGLNGNWVGDFWEHAAVVRELATHPWVPLHPILLSDAPHAFYSPYSLAVALLARAFDMTPVNALTCAGLFNLVGLLIALPLFIHVLFESTDHYSIAFYSLLLLLLLSGTNTWLWSGFFHIQALAYDLPYPSTFALVLTLVSIVSLLALVKSGRPGWLLVLLPTMAVVLLTHPTTALVMFILQFCVLVDRTSVPLMKKVFVAGSLFAASLLIALLWPYFSFAKLVLQQSPDFHSDSRVLYENVFPSVMPTLIGLPVIAWMVVKNMTDALGLSFVLLVIVYVACWYTDKWRYGRVISNVMMLLQLSLGWALAQLENKLTAFSPKNALLVQMALPAVVLYVLLFHVNSNNFGVITQMARRTPP